MATTMMLNLTMTMMMLLLMMMMVMVTMLLLMMMMISCLVSQRPHVIWRRRRPHAKHSPIGEAKATPHARSGENWWEAGADTVPLEEAKATPHARSGKSHTPRSLMLLSTKDRIRNGPQPISNLMSNPNRCCHQLLAHQSLAHRQLLLCQAFP